MDSAPRHVARFFRVAEAASLFWGTPDPHTNRKFAGEIALSFDAWDGRGARGEERPAMASDPARRLPASASQPARHSATAAAAAAGDCVASFPFSSSPSRRLRAGSKASFAFPRASAQKPPATRRQPVRKRPEPTHTSGKLGS